MITNPYQYIKVIAFDADDTLWDCQSHFEAVEKEYCDLLADYGTSEEISAALFQTETRNMPELGYGSKAFTLSLIENAVKVSQGHITADTLLHIEMLGRRLLNIPATPLPGVEEALKAIRSTGHQKMVVFTKGEILDQENKLLRSGLWSYFDRVEVVADKTPRQYRELCATFGIGIDELLMVGNSFKSDIEPVLRLGGFAVHVPFRLTWAHEVVEEFDHHRLARISHISQLPQLLQGE
jgi:putative hydrolase of the HAD superfamily